MKHLVPMILLLLLATQVVFAEQARIACSDIADASKRLACFDRISAQDTDREVPEGRSSTSAEMQSTIESAKVQSSEIPAVTVAGPTETATAPAPSPQVDSYAGDPKPARLGAKGKFSTSSRLKSVRDVEGQKMIFLLENDQIWLQDSPRSLPFTKGQDVTIESGSVGGYLLSNGEGVSTRVRRIK